MDFSPQLVLLFFCTQLLLKELRKCKRLVIKLPMNMDGYYGESSSIRGSSFVLRIWRGKPWQERKRMTCKSKPVQFSLDIYFISWHKNPYPRFEQRKQGETFIEEKENKHLCLAVLILQSFPLMPFSLLLTEGNPFQQNAENTLSYHFSLFFLPNIAKLSSQPTRIEETLGKLNIS